VKSALHPNDDLLRRIARGGGLIGVGIFRSDFLTPMPESFKWKGQQLRTCDDKVAIWRHIASVAGEDAVVLGSDYGSVVDRARPGGFCPHGLRTVADTPYLWAGLLAHGTPEKVLTSQADRVLKLWRRVEAARRAAPSKSAPRVHGFFDVPL